jgi:hypothetical protein
MANLTPTNKKITELPVATTVAPTDLLIIVQGGITKQVSQDTVAAAVAGSTQLAARYLALPAGGTNGQVLGLVNGAIAWVTPSGGGSTPALTNTATPAISGTTQTGNTLTVSNGTWSATPDSFAYQWRRAGASISGATSNSYVLVPADVGQAIDCLVTALKNGYSNGTSPSSSVTPTAPGGGAVALTDNGNGTYTVTGTGVTDNGNGTLTISDSTVADNGDGTYSLAA